MTSKQAKTLADQVNGVIHSRNLYRNGRRFINAQVRELYTGIHGVLVQDLYTETTREFSNDGSFVDGYGQAVIV